MRDKVLEKKWVITFPVAVLLALTIVGIPFAWAHLKLAGLALWPIGKVIVPAQAAGTPPWR